MRVIRCAPGDDKLQVHTRADRLVAESRLLPGVGNQHYAEAVVLHLDHGEAHAIDGDGTLLDNQFSELRREAEPRGFPLATRNSFEYGSYAIHMTGNEVSAE